MKVALLTGTGQDSKTLAHILLSKNYHVILTYRRNTHFDPNNLLKLFVADLIKYPDSSITLEFCDITDQNSITLCLKEVITKFGKIDELYLLAGQSSVIESEKNVLYTITANGISVFYFLEAIKDLSKSTKVFFAATSELFAQDGLETFANETTPFKCKNAYSISKLLGHNWVEYYRENKGLFCCSAFLFSHSNIYRGLNFYSRIVTNGAAKIALGKETELKLGSIDHWRDEFYADLGCEVIWCMLQNPAPSDYVIGSGNCYSGEMYLDIVFKYFSLDWVKYVKIDKTRFRKEDKNKLIADSTKARNELDWRPEKAPLKQHLEIMAKFDYELEGGIF